MGFSKICSVCFAPDELRNRVNELLDEKPRTKTFKEIAAAVSAFSKSSIFRHSRHYGGRNSLPRIYKGEKVFILWEGQDVPPNARSEDWVVQISYEKPLTPECAPNSWPLLSPEEQTTLLALEQAEREAAETIEPETIPPETAA